MSGVATAVVAGTVIGGVMSSNAQKDAASTAANAAKDSAAYQAKITWDMYNQNRQDLLPYIEAGQNALNQLTGKPAMQSVDYYVMKDGYSVPIDEFNKNPAKYGGTENITGTTQHQKYIQTAPVDPTGGAQQYLDKLNAVQFPNAPAFPNVDPTGGASEFLNNLKNLQFPNVDPTGGAQTYLDKLNAITFPSGVDPTGGMQKYIDQLDQLEFKLDTEDPIYKWRASENERVVNQFMASRGKYDSRAAANMLLKSGMELQADETDRQFNQRYLSKYQQLTDLANLSFQKGQAQYGQAVDKYSADVSKNMNALNSALALGQARYGSAADKYNADVSKNMNAINTALSMGRLNYGAAADRYNAQYTAGVDKYNADISKIVQEYNMTGQIGNTQYNQLLDLIKLGTGASNTAGQWGQNTASQLANISNVNSQAQQDAQLAQGQANAAYWSGIGSLPANMAAIQYYTNKFGA